MQPTINDIIDSYYTSDRPEDNYRTSIAPPYVDTRINPSVDLGYRPQRPPPLPPRARVSNNSSHSTPPYTFPKALRMASFEGGQPERSSDQAGETSRLSTVSSGASILPPPAYTSELGISPTTSSAKPPSMKQRWSDKLNGMALQRTSSHASSTLVDSPAGSEDGDPEDREDPLYKNVTRIAVEGEGAETSADITADGRIDVRL